MSIRRGRFDPETGLIFEDVQISEPASSSFQFRSQRILHIERLTVVANVRPENLLDKKNPFVTRRIVLEGLQANAWLDGEDQISLAKLFPMPVFGPAAPIIQLRDARVRLIGGKANDRPVDLEISQGTLVNRTTEAGSTDRTITLEGQADFARHFIVRCDLVGGVADVRASIKGVHLNRDLFGRLPTQWSKLVQEARDLDCVCDASLALNRSADGKLNYKIRTTVHDGRFNHATLPRSLSQLRGVMEYDPSGMTIHSGQGMFGDALLRVSGKIHGYQWPCRADLSVTMRGLLLDDQLAAAIPSSARAQWNRLQPLGRIDIDAELSHVASVWTTDATVVCKGVDVRYDKFPYPVQQLVGRVEIHDGIASSETLDGRIGGSRMQCAFRIPIRPGITNEKRFEIATDGPIPIDKTLLGALSPRASPTSKLESFVRSLRPSGSVHLASALLVTDANGKRTRKIDLRIVDGRLRYQRFAYPLYNVEGTIQVNDDLVNLVGFRATNANAGLILCDGGYHMPKDKTASGSQPPTSGHVSTNGQPSTSGQPNPGGHPATGIAAEGRTESHLSLSFRVSNVPLDESLRSSLPPSTLSTWDAIAPSGVLDELNVILDQHGGDNPISLDITAQQHSTHQVNSRTLSIRPVSLPYRLDITGGMVRFDGSRVIIDSIKARHDASTISADGGCAPNRNGRWELLLNVHSGSRLNPDAELIAALPDEMREAMRRLQLRGPVSIRGQTRLLMSDDDHLNPATDWNLVLQLEGNRIGDVGPVHSLRGELSVEGSQSDLGVRASGEVRIDSMHVNDLQITGIRGPFAVQNDRLYLGSGPVQRSRRPTVADLDAVGSTRSIRGRLFDGTLRLDGQVNLSRANFDVELAVTDAQVPTLLADFGYSDADLTGLFNGMARLQGNLESTDLLKGNGAARVSGANLYQLPLIVQVLNLLRITPTEDVAFTDGEVEFSIFGEAVRFSDLQIWGDLVALHGGGTLDLRRELDLTFDTRVSPQNTFSKIVRPLRSQRYTLWTIDVKGPLGSPAIERRAFEGVGETLERMFPAMRMNEESKQKPETVGLGSWFR